MKIIYNEEDVQIKLSDCESVFTFNGSNWDILELKNRMLEIIEKSFEKEVIELLKIGTFSKYKNK